MISGYVWILSTATIAGWILSWWGSRRIRWDLLSAAAVISLLCIVAALLVRVTPVGPDSGCRPALQCMDPHPIYWAEAGLIGFGCCMALMAVTIVVELAIRIGRRVSA